jgi:signal transduction histidine kinase
MVGIEADLTERVRMEEMRLQIERRALEAQKLESIGLLAGGVAHDLNNLLNVVLGNLEMLRIDPAPSTQERYLTRIENAAQHSADLMRQLLSVAGRAEGSAVICRVDVLAHEMADLLRGSIPRAIDLRVLAAADVPPVLGFAAQLRQVLINLIINAADAIGEGPGEIVVSTRRLSVPEEWRHAPDGVGDPPAGAYVALEVRDSGAGMDEATRARIFEPFYTTKPDGRGLGLAAALGIVRAHAGALGVTSAPGAGSTFTVLLPPLQETP